MAAARLHWNQMRSAKGENHTRSTKREVGRAVHGWQQFRCLVNLVDCANGGASGREGH